MVNHTKYKISQKKTLNWFGNINRTALSSQHKNKTNLIVTQKSTWYHIARFQLNPVAGGQLPGFVWTFTQNTHYCDGTVQRSSGCKHMLTQDDTTGDSVEGKRYWCKSQLLWCLWRQSNHGSNEKEEGSARTLLNEWTEFGECVDGVPLLCYILGQWSTSVASLLPPSS